jgi:hypothetical protein
MTFWGAYLLCFSVADRAVEARRSRFVEEKFLRREPTGPPAVIAADFKYRIVGCWIPKTFDDKIEDQEPAVAMTIDQCFIFCKQEKDKLVDFLGAYFGITEGDKCWCASTYGGEDTPDECTTPCSGGGPGCGGSEASSIYYMYQTNPTNIEKLPEVTDLVKEVAPEATKISTDAAEDLASKLPRTAQHADFNGDGVLDAHEITHAFGARFFVFHESGTCGQANPVKAHGRATMVASLVDCQMTCVMSRDCGGFTFDEGLRQCAFVGDVESGSVESGNQYVCYARITGDYSKPR